MGLCSSAEAGELGPQTVLVAGEPGSGRGTLVKQMRVILGRFDEAERKEHLRLIHRLLIRHMRRAVHRAEAKGAVKPEIEDSARYVAEKLSESIAIDARGADHLAVLWDDSFLKHSVQQADPAMSHLFDKLDDVVRSGYLPTDLDLMHVGAVTQGFSIKERAAHVRAIHVHVLRLVKARIRAAGDRLPKDMRQRAELLAEVVRESDPIDVELAGHIRSLWRCSAFRNAVAGDNAGRFLERIRDIGHPGWVPNDEDLLFVNDPALRQAVYRHDSAETGMTWIFRQHDAGAGGDGAGGKRAGEPDPSRRLRRSPSSSSCASEAPEAAAGLVFAVDCSAYEPREDGTNPLLEALDEFERLLSTPPYENMPVFLVLTKRDMLGLRLARTPLTVCFPDYEERVDGVIAQSPEDAAVQYIMDRFQEKEAAMQLVSHHAVVATDTDAVNSVWMAVQDVVLRVACQRQR